MTRRAVSLSSAFLVIILIVAGLLGVLQLTSTSGPVGSPLPFKDTEAGSLYVGGFPRTIAVNPVTDTVYVADWFNNSLTVVNASNYSVVARIDLPGANNNGIIIDDGSDMVYVLVAGGVAEVNGTTNKVAGEIPIDLGPGSLAYDPSTHTLYGSQESTLVGANAQTGAVVSNISLGYWADSVAVDPKTDTVVAAGCDSIGLACNSVATVVNETSHEILAVVKIGNFGYPRVTMNLAEDIAYVSGSALIIGLGAANGEVVFSSNSLSCPPLDSMAVDPAFDQVLSTNLTENYTLAYDGLMGAVVNIYSLPGNPQFVAVDPVTNIAFATLFDGQLLAFHVEAGAGYVNAAPFGAVEDCGIP
ncbi:MAG: YncE family protein [Nitrososphaerales archaeon]